MLKIDRKDFTLSLNRGDAISFDVGMKINGERYTFKAGDMLRLKVYEKKACNCVLIQKDFAIETDSEKTTISLTENETRVCGIINKPVDYWYEVEFDPLNNPITIIGYDDNGPKIFRLFPEGQDIDAPEILPEDIPVVDKQLDLTSERPVENQAITKAVRAIEQVAVDQSNAIGVIIDTANAHYQNNENPHNVTKAQVGLGNVPNVTTNDQTPTYEQAGTLDRLQSGEKMSVAFGKIGRAISDFIDHLANKQNPHNVTKELVGLGNADNTADIDKPVSSEQAKAIADAKKAGTDAQITANDAMDMATINAENIKTKAETESQPGTFFASEWSESAPYTQEITVEGILFEDKPLVDIDLSNSEDVLGVIEAWGLVHRCEVTADNTIVAYCYQDVPAVDIPVVFKVVR